MRNQPASVQYPSSSSNVESSTQNGADAPGTGTQPSLVISRTYYILNWKKDQRVPYSNAEQSAHMFFFQSSTHEMDSCIKSYCQNG